MKVIEADFSQQWFLPPRIEDWIPADHPARFVREIVSGMDLYAMGFHRQVSAKGRPAYGNALLLRVWLMGYWERIRTCRKLEKACREHVAFIWLCGGHVPDHNTLWRFFRQNRKALRAVFRDTVRVAAEMELIGFVLQAVDGTKIEARCSGRGSFDRDSLESLLAKLDERIAELEREILASGEGGKDAGTSLPKELEEREQLRVRVQQALELIDNGETRHCQPIEPDARRMKCDGRNRFGHNAQAVVDEKAQVITGADVIQGADDHGQLVPMIEEARVNTDRKESTTLADGGYAAAEEFQAAEDAGCRVLARLPSGSRNDSDKPFHASRFTYDETRDVFICPQGRDIPFQRERTKSGKLIRVYRSTAVCRDCPVRNQCTKDRHGRTVEQRPGAAAVERMRERLTDVQMQELLEQRGRIIEPVFAQIKQNDQFRRWTFFGLESVKTQWALLCSTWNLRKIYAEWTTQRHPIADRMVMVPQITHSAVLPTQRSLKDLLAKPMSSVRSVIDAMAQSRIRIPKPLRIMVQYSMRSY